MSSTITLTAEEHSGSQTLSTTDTETTDTDSTHPTVVTIPVTKQQPAERDPPNDVVTFLESQEDLTIA
jgi:hypothetical protein